MLRAIVRADTQMPDAVKVMCTAVAQELEDFFSANLANALWAVATTGTPMASGLCP